MKATLTLDVTADSEAVMEKQFMLWLQDRGWHCVPPNQTWESLKEFMGRVGMPYNHEAFYRKRKAWERRGHVLQFSRTKAGAGRIDRICSNAAFDEFCRP